MFKLIKTKGQARRGELKTRRGIIQTPFFMPIATKGCVKTLSIEDIENLSPEIILSNTYHLMLRPGEKEIKKLGGLHKFMLWDKPILTDSGGYQVFSLSKMRKITEEGVQFNSHINGQKMFLSPEDSIRIQTAIGSDIMMVLDECVELPAKREYVEKSVEMTTRWAARCKKYLATNHEFTTNPRMKKKALLFGIVQGGLEKDLRIKSANDLVKIGFDGYAVGGLAVGEKPEEMYSVLDYICDELPADRPRYLMGVGYPDQIVEAVNRGIDMFDCVIPTREARHGRLYLFKSNSKSKTTSSKILNSKSQILNSKKKDFYSTININNEKFKFDLTPINKDSKFELLRNYSRAYLRHLFNTEDPLGARLATLNNLEFYLSLMEKIRNEI